MKARYRRNPPKPPPARETHESIRRQTEAFLKNGGQITRIPEGHTGISELTTPARHNGQRH